MEISCLSEHLCYQIEVQIDDVYSIFRYFQNNFVRNPVSMTYNPMYKPTYDNAFEVVGRDLDEWKDFYPDA